jgi:hypothetical protein
MDINRMLSELRSELAGVEQAIVVLERIARGRGKRRGRPPAWMSQARLFSQAPKKPARRPLSAATRARMTMAQRHRRTSEKRAEGS